MKNKIIITLVVIASSLTSMAQVGIGTNTPDASAKLDVSSNTKGLLPPRMTNAQKNAISSPAAGLMVWCSDCGSSGQMQVFNGSTWTDMIGSPSLTASSNGTAVVSAYTISGTSTGTLTVGVPATGVTQTIIATVVSVGSYNILSTTNGVTFAAVGTFSATGNQNLVLSASGTPTTTGSNSFTINTTPNCSFTKTAAFVCGTSTVTFTYNGSIVTYGTVSSTGSTCWLDRNLGASQVATSSNDASSYGHLFQWGRGADGHQLINSSTTFTTSSTDVPGNSNFIKNAGNWRSSQNDNLWQGVSGTNNPCPSGYRVPTMSEYSTELASWSSADHIGAYGSSLKLPLAGDRHGGNGNTNPGTYGNYWSSTVYNGNAYYLNFDSGVANIDNWSRSWGMPIRCIKN